MFIGVSVNSDQTVSLSFLFADFDTVFGTDDGCTIDDLIQKNQCNLIKTMNEFFQFVIEKRMLVSEDYKQLLESKTREYCSLIRP